MSTAAATFENVIEAGLDELVEICDPVRVEGQALTIELHYAQAILHFLRGELEELKSLTDSVTILFAGHPEAELLHLACRLRELIRARQANPELIAQAERALEASSSENLKWRGEIAILIATVCTVFDEYQRAMEFYTRAVTAFEKQGCMRKALRARMNVLVCESHLHPDRNLFARYHDLYRRSLRKGQRELIVATTCLLNISREYQRAGAYLIALKYCTRALNLFELQMGEMNYFLTLAHRAHLLCDLGRTSEARIDFEAAKLGNFKEVEAALQVIEPLLHGSRPQDTTSSDLIPTWRERIESSGQTRLSVLEEKLIAFLSSGPRDRVDILEEIYGSNLEYETKLNRFKSLLATLRKKLPTLVICEEGKYRLADEILIPTRKSNSAS